MLIGADSITCIDSTGTKVTVTEEQLAEIPDLTVGSGTGATGITAYAGGGQASATALTKTYNNVTVVATDGDSVKLPDAVLGKRVVVKNSDSAQVLAVFPTTGDEINGLAANAAVGIPPGCERTFWGISTGAWRTGEALTSIAPTAQKGALVVKAADSAGDTVTTITNASQAQASTITFPDLGAAWSVIGSEGAQTVNGVKTFGSPIVFKGATGISAFATGGQASATALTAQWNNVTTVATAGDSVKLPAAVLGQEITVRNSGAAALAVFPASGDAINALAANASVTVPVGTVVTFRAIDGTTWYSNTPSLINGLVGAAGQTSSPRLVHTGGMPARVSTDGTDATPVNTEVYIAEVFVPANMTVTGVAIFNGSAVSGNVKVGLADSTGAVVATSASTAQSGTDAYQRVAFTGTYAAKGPATYYVLLIVDNGTARYNAHTFGDFGAAKQTGQVFATGFTTITPPTTFTTALAPIASLY